MEQLPWIQDLLIENALSTSTMADNSQILNLNGDRNNHILILATGFCRFWLL